MHEMSQKKGSNNSPNNIFKDRSSFTYPFIHKHSQMSPVLHFLGSFLHSASLVPHLSSYLFTGFYLHTGHFCITVTFHLSPNIPNGCPPPEKNAFSPVFTKFAFSKNVNLQVRLDFLCKSCQFLQNFPKLPSAFLDYSH